MHETLGLMLVREGLISRPQLHEALRFQSVNGKQLGTCLLLLGYVRPEQLLAVLSRQVGVPAAEPGAVEATPLEVLQLAPLALCEALRAVCFNRGPDAILDLAFSNSALLGQLGQVADALGQPVRAFLALELEVDAAIERLRHASANLPGFHLVGPDGQPLALQVMHEDALPELTTRSAEERARDARRPDEEISSSDFGPALGLEPQVATDEIVLLERPLRIATTVQDAAQLARSIRPPRKPDTESRLARITLYSAAEQIHEAASVDEIGRLVAQCLLSYFSRAALFSHHEDVLALLVADGFERHIKDLPPARLDQYPHLHGLLVAGQSYYGPAEGELATALFDEVLSVLRVRRPATALLVPLYTKALGLTLVAYADNEDLADLYDDTGDLAILFKEAQTAIDLKAGSPE